MVNSCLKHGVLVVVTIVVVIDDDDDVHVAVDLLDGVVDLVFVEMDDLIVTRNGKKKRKRNIITYPQVVEKKRMWSSSF